MDCQVAVRTEQMRIGRGGVGFDDLSKVFDSCRKFLLIVHRHNSHLGQRHNLFCRCHLCIWVSHQQSFQNTMSYLDPLGPHSYK